MLPLDDCDIPEEPCSSAWDVGNNILQETRSALAELMAVDCDKIVSYMTVGTRGDDAIVDALTVSLATVNQRSTDPGVGLQLLNFDVRLRESGWPVASMVGARFVPPDPNLQNALARHVYAHAEVVYKTLLVMQRTNGFAPAGYRMITGTVGTLTPLAPTAGVIGFFVPVTVLLAW